MPFASFPFAFACDITEAVNLVRRSLQPSVCPPVLYHSTSFDGISGIISTRTLWGTCVNGLEDKTEIEHGVEMIETEIRQKLFGARDSVPGRVLHFVPEFLRDRRSWTFVVCFRGALERPTHADSAAAARCAEWDHYRPYCAEFETLSDWDTRLRLGINADHQYHRVVYDKDLQRAAIARVIGAVIDSITKNCTGTLEGPWAESQAQDHARIVAQCLIDMISGFKSPKHRWDDEWRIVCRPSVRLAGSAPDLDDNNFRPHIKSGRTRFVELAAHEQGPILSASPPRALPFRAIHVSDPLNSLLRERQSIRSMLDRSDRSDISIRVYPDVHQVNLSNQVSLSNKGQNAKPSRWC